MPKFSFKAASAEVARSTFIVSLSGEAAGAPVLRSADVKRILADFP